MEKKNLIREKPFTSQRTDKKRNFRYNDSKNKIKKKIKTIPPKENISTYQNNNYNANFNNIKPVMTEFSSEIRDEERPSFFTSAKTDNENVKRITLSVPKRHFLKRETKRGDINLKSCYNLVSRTDFSNLTNYNIDDFGNKTFKFGNYTQIPSMKYNEAAKNRSRTLYRPFLTEKQSDRSNRYLFEVDKNGNSTMAILNKILHKENRNLRERTNEKRRKIKQLQDKNKKLIKQIESLEDNNKNFSMKLVELDNKFQLNSEQLIEVFEDNKKKIEELKQENMRLKQQIREKENILLQELNDTPMENNINLEIENNLKQEIQNLNIINNRQKQQIMERDIRIKNLMNENKKIIDESVKYKNIAQKKIKELSDKLKEKIQSSDMKSKNALKDSKLFEPQIMVQCNDLREKNYRLVEENKNYKSQLINYKNYFEKLSNENQKLKKELLIAQNTNSKERFKRVSILNNDDENNMFIQNNNILNNDYLNEKEGINEYLSKINELQKKIEVVQMEKESKMKELQIQQKNNKILLNKNKMLEEENIKLKNSITNLTNTNNDNLQNNKNEEYEKVYGQLEMVKKENYDKNIKIKKLEKELKDFKAINDKLLEDNKRLKFTQNQEECMNITLENLKDEIKDKNLQIQKLKNSLKRNTMNVKNRDDNEDEKELEENPFRKTFNSTGMAEDEKIRMYKEQIKEYKQTNISDALQIKTLKEDIKILKNEVKNYETFGGQLKDYNEFINLLNVVLDNYKPKKKEQKDALNTILQILNKFSK